MSHRCALRALCAGVALAALPIAFSGPGVHAPVGPISTAHAQQSNRATQTLFLAVGKNDLPGAQAAIDGGADITARDINGMQAIDLAIERGYFDIAHYLISIRNQLQAQDGTVPSPEQLAQSQQAQQALQPAPARPVDAPLAPNLDPGAPNPFDAPRTDDGLTAIGQVREPGDANPRQTEVAQAAAPDALAAQAQPPTKPSAVKTFISTFADFFKAPNTTGIVRKKTTTDTATKDALTDQELGKQLKQIQAELGDEPIKGPPVPMSPDDLARELPPAPELPDNMAALGDAPLDTPALPPYSVTAPGETPRPQAPRQQVPEVSSEDAFGDLSVDDVTAADEQPFADAKDSSLPFGGGVDPDILALLGRGPAQFVEDEADPFTDQEADPFAEPADPFATPDQPTPVGPGSVAEVLDGLDSAQEVDPFATPGEPDSEPIDPFATQPQGDVDELAGLLEGVGENVAGQDGWDVKEIEGAALPKEMPVLADITPTGEPLDGIELALGADTIIGRSLGEDRLQLMKEDTIHRPCLQKGGTQTLYCVDKVSWPFELEEDFLVDTIMYQGTRTIARYDAGRASYYHALFRTEAFPKVVNYYIERFGQPTEVVERAIAPLAQPRRDNATYIWRTREPGTDTITTLELRQFDDARGGFPDTRRGVALLYRTYAAGIFPQLSQLELMVLKDSGALDLAPKAPEDVWQ